MASIKYGYFIGESAEEAGCVALAPLEDSVFFDRHCPRHNREHRKDGEDELGYRSGTGNYAADTSIEQ